MNRKSVNEGIITKLMFLLLLPCLHFLLYVYSTKKVDSICIRFCTFAFSTTHPAIHLHCIHYPYAWYLKIVHTFIRKWKTHHQFQKKYGASIKYVWFSYITIHLTILSRTLHLWHHYFTGVVSRHREFLRGPYK